MMAGYKKGKAIKLSKNFKTTEFDCKGKNCCSITLIDSELVNLLQKVRDHFNKPVIINSGYRCATHNKAVKGAPSSQHLYGKAADIYIKDVKPLEVYKYCDAIGVKGLGKYITFTHVDVRAKRARW